MTTDPDLAGLSTIAKAFYYMGAVLVAGVVGAGIGLTTDPFTKALCPYLVPSIGVRATTILLLVPFLALWTPVLIGGLWLAKKWAGLLDSN